MEEHKGFVYILTNPSMPDYIKIGFTNNLKARLRELDTTGVAMPFEPFFTIKTSKYKVLEKVIHRELDKLTDTRARANREFFKISPDLARDLILNISQLLDDSEIEDYGYETVKDELSEDGRIKPNSSATTFEMLGIPIGTPLEPVVDKYPKVVTVDNKNMVRLEDGAEKTISRAIVDVTGTSRNGFSSYKYNGVILSKLRMRMDKNYLPSMQK